MPSPSPPTPTDTRRDDIAALIASVAELEEAQRTENVDACAKEQS
jgi:hypothetical protein